MKKAVVIGYPIKHSLSPVLHTYWLNHYHIEGTYEAYEVSPDGLPGFIRSLADQGLCGCNITLPHKEHAVGLMDHVDGYAAKIGAVNTVVVQQDGSLYGTNTDSYGFIENIKAAHPGWKFSQGPALVLGAGGAARAVIAGLLEQGVPEIYLANRTPEKAELLKKVFGKAIQVIPWEKKEKSMSQLTLLVNTTSLGMVGKPPLDIQLGSLATEALVTDIVYRPLDTPLLVQAKKRGHRVVDGLGMLLYQAVPAFALWFHVTPEVTGALRQCIEKKL